MGAIEHYCAKCGAACSGSDPACGACGASLKVTRPLDQKALFSQPELRLAPDGQYLVTGGASTGALLSLVRAADGKQLAQASFDDPDALGYIVWSPDSRYLVFPTASTNNWQAGQHWSMTLWDSWKWRKVGEIGGDLPESQSEAYYAASGLAWSPDGKTIAVGINNDI